MSRNALDIDVPPSSHRVWLQAHAQPIQAPADQPLLVSAQQAGVELLASCRNGTCRTCIGQLHQGQVRYDIDWPGLSADEKAQGYVLPCVAIPCSDLRLSRGGD
jgi:ferredoxin